MQLSYYSTHCPEIEAADSQSDERITNLDQVLVILDIIETVGPAESHFHPAR